MTRKAVALFCVSVTLLAAYPSRAQTATTQSSRTARILFIGNSYTFYNGGLWTLVQAMAQSRGHDVQCVPSVSVGKTLEWHWNHGEARDAIAQGPWDVVILQEFSMRPIDEPAKMFDYARRFDAAIRAAGARTVFFMTWARQHQPDKQRILTEAYQRIASELGAEVAPVGDAWQRALKKRPKLKLYQKDRSHPNQAGSYLSACVIYATLFDDTPIGLPPVIRNDRRNAIIHLPPAEASFLQRIAAETVGVATQDVPTRPAAAD